ncbi:hypothetical protein Pan216_37620 [Planctomycetes bacterium Pan216]|uniref:Uncharacterized protein n=1 Tax=Kolteria novifilia TaxID=2527975 RepID=A0A518B7D1_9BACT|nr:hypothetical protein Pan216_37620 [Planctomycetes bacterium Pan216]
MVAPNKQRILTKVLAQLSKRYSDEVPKEMRVLDHLLLATIQEGMSFSRSLGCYRGLLSGFHDLNELRVSHPHELQDRLQGVPRGEEKAKRILKILQFVFETTYTFDLESMRRKPLKQAQKQLSKIAGTTDFVVCATVQRALGGHSMPVDSPMSSILAEVELIEEEDQLDRVRAALEHLVPKAKGQQFCIYVSEWAADDEKEAITDTIAPKRSGKTGGAGKTSGADKESAATEAEENGTKSGTRAKTAPTKKKARKSSEPTS